LISVSLEENSFTEDFGIFSGLKRPTSSSPAESPEGSRTKYSQSGEHYGYTPPQEDDGYKPQREDNGHTPRRDHAESAPQWEHEKWNPGWEEERENFLFGLGLSETHIGKIRVSKGRVGVAEAAEPMHFFFKEFPKRDHIVGAAAYGYLKDRLQELISGLRTLREHRFSGSTIDAILDSPEGGMPALNAVIRQLS
jgi:hypothetical protein